MKRKPNPEDQPELERLLERIQCGTIEDAEELDEQSLELLRKYYGNEEDIEDLLERLRGEPREQE